MSQQCLKFLSLIALYSVSTSAFSSGFSVRPRILQPSKSLQLHGKRPRTLSVIRPRPCALQSTFHLPNSLTSQCFKFGHLCLLEAIHSCTFYSKKVVDIFVCDENAHVNLINFSICAVAAETARLELTLGELVKTLVTVCKTGTLCTTLPLREDEDGMHRFGPESASTVEKWKKYGKEYPFGI